MKSNPSNTNHIEEEKKHAPSPKKYNKANITPLIGTTGNGISTDLMMGLINKKQPQVANFTGEKEYIIK